MNKGESYVLLNKITTHNTHTSCVCAWNALEKNKGVQTLVLKEVQIEG